MNKLIDLVLWLLTFPVAFLFAYAINLIIAVILSSLIGEELSKALMPLTEVTLFPFTFDLILIWSSYHTIPANPMTKWKVVMIFFLFLFLLSILTAFVNPLSNVFDTSLRIVFSVLGGVTGLIIVNKKANKDLDKLESHLKAKVESWGRQVAQEMVDNLNSNVKNDTNQLYPRFFIVDDVPIRVEKEGDEIAGYSWTGAPYSPFKALNEGIETDESGFNNAMKALKAS